MYMLRLINFSFSFKRVEKNTSLESEPKFLVFYSMLLSLFSMFCFREVRGIICTGVALTLQGFKDLILAKWKSYGRVKIKITIKITGYIQSPVLYKIIFQTNSFS